MRSPALLVCVIAVWLCSAARVHASMEPTTLGKLAHGSDTIIVGTVKRIVEVPLLEPSENDAKTARLAEVVVREWVRGTGGESVWFLASLLRDWEGNDVTWAEAGDQGLFFLEAVDIPELVVDPAKLKALTGGRPVLVLAYSGRGRMLSHHVGGQEHVSLTTKIRVPFELETIPGRDPRFRTIRRLLPLREALEYLRKRLAEPVHASEYTKKMLSVVRRAVDQEFEEDLSALDAVRERQVEFEAVMAKALLDEEHPWREDMAQVLLWIDEESLAVVRMLLTDKALSHRRAGAFVLGFARQHSGWNRDARVDVFDALEDRDPVVRGLVIRALGHVDQDDEGFYAIATRLLRDPDPSVRVEAMRTWATRLYMPEFLPTEIGRHLPRIRGALAKEAGSSSRDARRAAWEVLSVIGRAADLPLIRRGLADDDPVVQAAAATALGRGATPASRRLLLELLAHKSAHLRIAAAHGLGLAKASDAIQSLIGALQDAEPLVVSCAVWALGEIGPAAREALPLLEELRKERPKNDVAYWCDEAIEQISR